MLCNWCVIRFVRETLPSGFRVRVILARYTGTESVSPARNTTGRLGLAWLQICIQISHYKRDYILHVCIACSSRTITVPRVFGSPNGCTGIEA